jgi:hypothetical protein
MIPKRPVELGRIVADDVTLDLIGRQLERVLAALRDARLEQRFVREELRNMAASLARLEDTIAMDMLERIRKLEMKP